jgi:hypothetical protein
VTIPADPGYRRDHKCQTPECPNDYAVIIVRVDDSGVDMLCDSCHIAMMMAIIKQSIEQGTLRLEDTPPATAGAAQQ